MSLVALVGDINMRFFRFGKFERSAAIIVMALIGAQPCFGVICHSFSNGGSKDFSKSEPTLDMVGRKVDDSALSDFALRRLKQGFNNRSLANRGSGEFLLQVESLRKKLESESR